MNVKTDTKEKFTVITPLEREISANMADKLADILLSYPERQPPHLVLNLEKTESIADEAVSRIAAAAARFRERDLSFVTCCLQKQPLSAVQELELEEILNITPTESEAWDILQMEEIERELMSGDSGPDNP